MPITFPIIHNSGKCIIPKIESELASSIPKETKLIMQKYGENSSRTMLSADEFDVKFFNISRFLNFLKEIGAKKP